MKTDVNADRLLGLYWYTRQVSTGLAIEMLLIETVMTILVCIVQASITWVDADVVWLSFFCAGLILIAVKQAFLYCRVQIQLSGFVPTAFRIRGYQGEEWPSYRKRRQLGWSVPAAVSVAAGLMRDGR